MPAKLPTTWQTVGAQQVMRSSVPKTWLGRAQSVRPPPSPGAFSLASSERHGQLVRLALQGRATEGVDVYMQLGPVVPLP